MAFLLFVPKAVAAPIQEEEPPLEAIALTARTSIHIKAPEAPKRAQVERTVQRPVTVPSTVPESAQALVEAEFGKDHIMVSIARAESQFLPTAKNPSSTATGVFQILIGTWNWYQCEGSRIDAADNIRCARKIYDREGTRPWNASAAAWR